MSMLTKAQAVTAMEGAGVINAQEVADKKFFGDNIESGRVNSAIGKDAKGWMLGGEIPAQYYAKISATNTKYGDADQTGLIEDCKMEFEWIQRGTGKLYLYMADSSDLENTWFVQIEENKLTLGFEADPTYEYPEYDIDPIIADGARVRATVQMLAGILSVNIWTADRQILDVKVTNPVYVAGTLHYVEEFVYSGSSALGNELAMWGDIKIIDLEDAATDFPDVDEVITKVITKNMGTLTATTSTFIYGGTSQRSV